MERANGWSGVVSPIVADRSRWQKQERRSVTGAGSAGLKWGHVPVADPARTTRPLPFAPAVVSVPTANAVGRHAAGGSAARLVVSTVRGGNAARRRLAADSVRA